MNVYKDKFYRDRHEKTVYSAQTILSIILDTLPTVMSAVDVGCGVGTWLSVLRNIGIEEIQGIDGSWVNKELLQIPVENFMIHDLNIPINFNKKFDLAISLEVAEHLPEVIAQSFVTSLTKSADFVLFSAAIPYQGGQNHVNERWLEYWNNLFHQCGYIGLDIVRRRIWNDNMIPVWYRQNIILFALEKRIPELKLQYEIAELTPVSIIHPEIYSIYTSQASSLESYINSLNSVKSLYNLFLEAIVRKLKFKRIFKNKRGSLY
ncbi:bifunctional 2-polyprenyl-6-hydroxyphenol methylase/3-demethylubiquinol 3-O-methyltransferase UbiG [Nostoc sp. FACHB-133]|uniref:class I SAM-dependent methyltransferase n=1 Tax=Nostoc sp. FACHB-133 TaxID=2692835 RepID=UPI001681E102|nr:methyltransferase domain-containing protein [Nostoc sp. FACHB-133]MBD2526702.1 methyltransferase domain-containing protein [Nostoc sp. FACHB-133]